MKVSAQVLSIFEKVKFALLLIIVFLFPLFFLPTTQEFFTTNKIYLLSFGAIVLFAISTIEFLLTKRFVWAKGSLDSVVVLFLFTIGLSTLFSSPNKVQALLNPNLGVAAIAALTILYFYITRYFKGEGSISLQSNRVMRFLSLSSLIVSGVAILFFFNPLKNTNLPQYLQFLKSNTFNTMGASLDLALFLGFFVAVHLASILARKHAESNKTLKAVLPSILSLFVTGVALALTVFTIVKPAGQALTLPPLSVSWYSAVEILKNPVTALFGIGIDNYASIFTRAKDTLYNASSLWQISSFNLSSSMLLHILTEVGIFGLIAFVLLILSVVREALNRGKQHGNTVLYILPVAYLVIAALIFPPSFAVLFLIYMAVSVFGHRHAVTEESSRSVSNVDLENLLPVYLGMVIVAILFIGASGYLLTRSYVAEYNFKKSIDAVANNNMQDLYNSQRDAIIMNPFIERFHANFSQTNLLLANNVANQAVANASKNNQDGQAGQIQISEQDRQTIAKAIQAAISEAKASVTLNASKAANWENLAAIYRNVLNVAQGADAWTISSYQRAIVLDPQNAGYRLNLGGVYYSLQNFEEAAKMFEQTTSLKPDWNNAHYNLAWASFQRGDYQRAVGEMQTVMYQLDPKKDTADYQRALAELEKFKEKLPKQEQASSDSGEPKQLSLPTPPAASVSPKLQLPNGASPENQ